MLEVLDFELNKPGFIQTFEKLALRCQFTTLRCLISALRLLFFFQKSLLFPCQKGAKLRNSNLKAKQIYRVLEYYKIIIMRQGPPLK